MTIQDAFYSYVTKLMQGAPQKVFVVGGTVRSQTVNAPEGGGDPIPVLVDEITNAQVVISVPHHEIHEGEAFTAGYMSPHGSLVADNGNIDLVLMTGVKYAHLTARGTFGGDFEGYLYEDTIVTGGSGTLVTPQNHKRAGGGAATLAVRHSMTVTNPGTILEAVFVPGGTGGNSVGSVADQRFEWILKQNSTYLLRLTNRAGNAKQGSIGAAWYEESSN